jgi:hypothetical protein
VQDELTHPNWGKGRQRVEKDVNQVAKALREYSGEEVTST